MKPDPHDPGLAPRSPAPGATTPSPSVAAAPAENDLRRVNAELERRLAERTSRLEAAMKELETFSYSVSHDLRTPLRAIDGFARMLAEDYTPVLDTEGRRKLETIRSEARRMGLLIDAMLAFSRAGRQELDAAAINMTELAESAFQNLAEATTEKIPAFDLKPLPPSWADRRMVREIFNHLLDNALKFSRRQPEPRIEVTGRTEGGWSIYCVKDNGVGFDERYLSRLFGIFQRLHSQEDFEGTGVGLALVQRIVLRHGGKVWAEGRLGAGAAFYFTLPQLNDAVN